MFNAGLATNYKTKIVFARDNLLSHHATVNAMSNMIVMHFQCDTAISAEQCDRDELRVVE